MDNRLTTTQTAAPSLAAGTAAAQAVELFAASTDVKETTRALYKRTLNAFFGWVHNSGRMLDGITIADLIEYKAALFAADKSPLTIASYVNSIRRFYTWAESVKLYPNIAGGLKPPKRKQRFRKEPLSAQQAASLIKHEKAASSARDYAIVNLMLYTGLRCIEVTRANVGDIIYKGGQRILLVQGKGRDEKDNFVILTDAAYLPVLEYLNTRPDGRDAAAPLFTSVSNRDKGGRLTTRAVSGIVKAGLRSVGLDAKCFTAHSLRHTAAVSILEAGGTLQQVQFALRHSNPATTQIYTYFFDEKDRIKNGGELLLADYYSRAI